MIKLLTTAVLLLLALVVGYDPAYGAPVGGPIVSQVQAAERSSADLAKFADAYRAVFDIQQGAEANMAAAVEAEGLTIERFGEIAEARQADGSIDQATISEAETADFTAAVDQILTIRQDAEREMATAIEAQGLTLDNFNQILDEAEQDAQLRQRIAEQFQE